MAKCVCGRGRTLSPEELAGDVERLAADDNDLLAVEELLGDSAGETSEKVAWLCAMLVVLRSAVAGCAR